MVQFVNKREVRQSKLETFAYLIEYWSMLILEAYPCFNHLSPIVLKITSSPSLEYLRWIYGAVVEFMMSLPNKTLIGLLSLKISDSVVMCSFSI